MFHPTLPTKPVEPAPMAGTSWLYDFALKHCRGRVYRALTEA
jgi:hypothetical protein